MLAYLICAFIMMIGYSFITSLPEGLESRWDSWLTYNYFGLLIISFPLTYIINDLMGLFKSCFSKKEKGLSFNFFPLNHIYITYLHNTKIILKK